MRISTMDEWMTTYLQTWQSDFGTEPDAESCYRFLKTVLFELQRLSQGGPTNTDSIHERVSNSIIAAIRSLPDPDPGLEYIQDVLFDAAISSPLTPGSLANATRRLIDNLPKPLNENLEKGIASNTRERWNGPDTSTLGKEEAEYIDRWVSLNSFVAHLTRLHVSLGDYGVWTLDRAFNPHAGGYLEDERIYHIPAAAAWIDILSAEIYGGSQQGDLPREKWEQWKRGFRTAIQSDAFPAATKDKAQMAFNRMIKVEKSGEREV